MKVKHIYLDNAATTPMTAPVIETMIETMKNVFGNASSTHFYGRKARAVLDDSRHLIAKSINAKRMTKLFLQVEELKAIIQQL